MINKTAFMISCLMLLSALSFAQEVEFNYNGRVKVEGQAYSGAGLFKFALVDKQGTNIFWANDGVTLDGSQPLSAVTGEVKDGFFSVNIGDTDTTNMASLDASIFNSKERILLRTWFSDGSHGFEQLRPDREVVNPALLGTRSFKETVLYVDPLTGNDTYRGLKASKPKKTIQSAWDALPPMLETTATICLADGTYRESVRLRGKTIIGEGSIRIIGNDLNPMAVRLTGSTEANDTMASRDNGFLISGIKNLAISGIFFDYFANAGVDAWSAAEFHISKCIFKHNLKGIRMAEKCMLQARNLQVEGPGSSIPWSEGIESRTFCIVDIWDTSVTGFEYGLTSHQSYLAIYGQNSVSACRWGIYASAHGFVGFPSNGMEIKNCTVGVHARLLSAATYIYLNHYSGNGTDIQSQSGAVLQ